MFFSTVSLLIKLIEFKPASNTLYRVQFYYPGDLEGGYSRVTFKQALKGFAGGQTSCGKLCMHSEEAVY